MTIKLNQSWLDQLAPEFEQPYMAELKAFLLREKQQGKTIYPKGDHIFAALNAVDVTAVRVVILGQDPYHNPGQAHGLSFSVPQGVRIPPSLVNIFQEIGADVGGDIPGHGYLKPWADQGVLLLNSVLTVERGLAASHQRRGWERFTDKIIAVINDGDHPVVFMLWGSYAQNKAKFVDRGKHLILTAPHPSPLSAHRGFFGCRHFSRANAFLTTHYGTPIDWLGSLAPTNTSHGVFKR